MISTDRAIVGSMGHVAMGPALDAPVMETMNFLNEAAARYPSAISFAAGRPPDAFADASVTQRLLESYVAYRAATRACPPEQVWRELGQYGDTNGMIADLIARWLKHDEGVVVDPRAIMVTNGFQEALLVVLLGLFDRDRDTVIAEDPSYVGLAGAAAIAGVPVESLAVELPILEAVTRSIESVRRRGRVPRAIYLIPDYSNPTGRCLSLAEREALIALAKRERLFLLEDTAYRAFSYEGSGLPSLKALDDARCVISLGSFAKVFMPGVRLGFMLADQHAEGGGVVAEALSKVKSFVSVLTSPITQAAVGGLLVENEFSLRRHCAEKVAECGRRRAHLLGRLEQAFAANVVAPIRWNRPSGGFFVVVTLPFEFGRRELVECARDYGVIVCPMSFFALGGGFRNQVRLAFSNVSPDRIDEGVERFHRYVRDVSARRHGTPSSSDERELSNA